MLNNLIQLLRNLFAATPAQWASQKLSDKEICDAIITTMNNPHNNYDLY